MASRIRFDGTGELRLELTAHDLAEPLAQGVSFLPELLAGLASTIGQDEKS